MEKVDIDVLDGFHELLLALRRRQLKGSRDEEKSRTGFLQVSADGEGKPNVTTQTYVDTGMFGFMGPSLNVYVRPTRYTYTLLEQNGDFTLNVPRPGELGDVINFCGKATGRRTDKFQKKNLTAVPSRHVAPPIVGECCMHFECSAFNKYDQKEEDMCERLRRAYHSPGYASVFMGLVEAAYADADIAETLSKH